MQMVPEAQRPQRVYHWKGYGQYQETEFFR